MRDRTRFVDTGLHDLFFFFGKEKCECKIESRRCVNRYRYMENNRKVSLLTYYDRVGRVKRKESRTFDYPED